MLACLIVNYDIIQIFMKFIPQCVLQQVHSHFQRQFSTHCDLVLPRSIFRCPLIYFMLYSSCLLLLTCLPVTSILPPTCPSLTYCKRQFPRKIWPFHSFPLHRSAILVPLNIQILIVVLHTLYIKHLFFVFKKRKTIYFYICSRLPHWHCLHATSTHHGRYKFVAS